MQDRLRIVLLRTHNGQNLGAVARAMNNFGLSNLVLADLGAVRWSDVHKMAVRSDHLTEQAARVDSLEAAVKGCAWVVGTTMRARPGQRHLSPREAAAQLVELSATQDVALVFGGERVGLTNADLLHCHDVSAIPTDGLASLNLAQSVLVYLWEIAQARGRAVAPEDPAPRATEDDYGRLDAALRAHMARVGFTDPDRPRHGVKDLLQTLKRAGLTEREAQLWLRVLRPR